MQEKFLKNVPLKTSKMVRKELAKMGNIRLRIAEAAQQKIVDITASLEKKGRIAIESRREKLSSR